MPADILGSEVLETGADGARAFKFIEGPIFCQLLMADEINRASPRTQSALLQAMQERQVTMAGQTGRWRPSTCWPPRTRSSRKAPIPCPRRSSTGSSCRSTCAYPDRDTERDILLATTGAEEDEAHRVFTAEELIEAQTLLRRMPVGESVVEMILDLVRAFRPEDERRPRPCAKTWPGGPARARRRR